MGGKIFQKQGVTARRIAAPEFNRLSSEIDFQLQDIFTKTHVVQAFRDKKDHGDIDFLISDPVQTHICWQTQIKNVVPHTHFAANGDEISLLVSGAQIDFRYVKLKHWDSTVAFSDFDPLSNSLGRISRFLGLRYGYKGLDYHIYTENGQNKLEIINISNDTQKIFEFLGLNYYKWIKGFETKEDIFQFIISCKYYSPECFKEENWNHSTRTRNRKRKLFCEFVEFTKNHNVPGYQFAPKDQKDIYIPMISEFFNIDLQKQIDEARAKYKKDLELYEKWNGHKMIEQTGIEGAELGKLIGAWKEYIKLKFGDYNKFLEDHAAEQIEKIFENWYKNP